MKVLITSIVMSLAISFASGGSSDYQQAPAQVTTTKATVGVGDLAPDFTLQDNNGNSVKLSDAKGKTPVVLVFYRGYW